MDITLLIGLAAVFFILGILFIIKGAASEEQNAVPISNPEEIQKLKKSFMPTENRDQSGDVHQEGMTAKSPSDAMGAQRDAIFKKEIEELKKENARIRETFEAKIKGYENKIQKISAETSPDQKVIEDLKMKGDQFEKWLNENQGKQEALQEKIAQLETEKKELERSQKLGVNSEEFESITSRLQNSIAAIETLKGENQELQESNETLKNDVQKANDRNVQLIEKERIMEYELSKNRAQALGLEKLCEGFKAQIEKLAATATEKTGL